METEVRAWKPKCVVRTTLNRFKMACLTGIEVMEQKPEKFVFWYKTEIKLGLPFMVHDLLYKFQMTCLRKMDLSYRAETK